jgi:transposase-like protein
MAAKAPKQRAAHRRLPSAEKRRLVELTLRPGSSPGAIARERGVHPNSLRRWKALFLAGKLEAQSQRAITSPADGPAAKGTFSPVNVIRVVPEQPNTNPVVAPACFGVAAMSVVASGTRVWRAAGVTDMRKGFTG